MCMYVCMYVCMFVRMYVYMYLCMYVCMYVRMYVSMWASPRLARPTSSFTCRFVFSRTSYPDNGFTGKLQQVNFTVEVISTILF